MFIIFTMEKLTYPNKSHPSPNKDKTYEEIFGIEKAKKIRKNIKLHHWKKNTWAKPRYGKDNPFFGKRHTEETKLKSGKIISKSWLNFKKTKKYKVWRDAHSKFRRKQNLINNPMNNPITREKANKTLSVTFKKMYKEHPEEVTKRLVKTIPNSQEIYLKSLLEQYFPNEWKFVGNGEVILGGKNPDFINVNGKKFIIELFGNRWHTKLDENIRISHFSHYGYRTLIIWSKELRDKNSLMNKINEFIGGDANERV